MKIINHPFAFLSAICLSLMLPSTVSAQSADAGVRQAIINANQKFCDVFSQSGGSGVAAFYADNAMLLPPNGETVGSAGIAAYWKGGFDAGIKKVKIETGEVESMGKSAVETGKYMLFDGTDKLVETGKYMVYWKNEKGQWKLYRDMWSSNMPAK
jgi:ketosteroid isomerase-like protein